MNPGNMEEWLTSYALGELENEKAQAVETYLQENESAQRMLEEINETLDFLQKTLKTPLPIEAGHLNPSVRAAVLASPGLESPVTPAAPRGRSFSWMKMAASLAILGGAAWIGIRQWLGDSGRTLSMEGAPTAPAIPTATSQPADDASLGMVPQAPVPPEELSEKEHGGGFFAPKQKTASSPAPNQDPLGGAVVTTRSDQSAALEDAASVAPRSSAGPILSTRQDIRIPARSAVGKRDVETHAARPLEFRMASGDLAAGAPIDAPAARGYALEQESSAKPEGGNMFAADRTTGKDHALYPQTTRLDYAITGRSIAAMPTGVRSIASPVDGHSVLVVLIDNRTVKSDAQVRIALRPDLASAARRIGAEGDDFAPVSGIMTALFDLKDVAVSNGPYGRIEAAWSAEGERREHGVLPLMTSGLSEEEATWIAAAGMAEDAVKRKDDEAKRRWMEVLKAHPRNQPGTPDAEVIRQLEQAGL